MLKSFPPSIFDYGMTRADWIMGILVSILKRNPITIIVAPLLCNHMSGYLPHVIAWPTAPFAIFARRFFLCLTGNLATETP